MFMFVNDRVIVRSYDPGKNPHSSESLSEEGQVVFHDLYSDFLITISHKDFCDVVQHFMIQTPLQPKDPRMKLKSWFSRLKDVFQPGEKSPRFTVKPSSSQRIL